VRRRLLHPGLRTQLAVAISVVTMLAVAASFLALYEGTAARLRGQIDSQLRSQGVQWRDFERGHPGAQPPLLFASTAGTTPFRFDPSLYQYQVCLNIMWTPENRRVAENRLSRWMRCTIAPPAPSS